MKNRYKVEGEETTIYCESPKYGSVETVISTADLSRVKEFPNTWSAVWCKGTESFYISGKYTIASRKRKYVYLHRWILKTDDSSTVVDHVNRDTLDNKRRNLNLVTQAENVQNRGIQRNNTSGYPGVTWDKRQSKWVVTINILGVQTYVGAYTYIEEAIVSRKEVEREHLKYKQSLVDLEAN